MRAHHRLTRLLLCLTAGLANVAWAYPEYRVTVVGPAGSSASGINNDGVVIGDYPFSSTSRHGFLNRGKGLVDLGALGGSASSAVAINDKGQVLAHWTTAGGQTRGFIYHAGNRRDIGVLPGRNTTYTDINNHGFITAYGTVSDDYENQRSFLRAPDGSLTDLGALPFEHPLTYANALNNGNRITGASGPLTFPDQPLRAFLWSKGSMIDVGGFGWEPNYGEAINDCGQVTGSMSVLGGFRNRIAFLYSNGRLQDLDGRPASAERDSAGAGINRYGHVVGTSNHLSGFVYRGKRMQSLNALVDPKGHWDIRQPRAINNAGQIAATADRAGLSYAVRLDLIRPLLLRAPEPDLEEQAAPAAAAQPLPAPLQELAQPVGQ